MNKPFEIAGQVFQPGTRTMIRVPVAQRLTAGHVEIPCAVVHGRREGPSLLVSAALHGDEINGTEIVRRILMLPMLKKLKGTLIAVPVVNVYGFVTQQRYLPDRRDLNRSFPGSPRGSLAARVANTFVETFLSKATHAIDLHTGAIHRTNLPQIRARLAAPGVEAMARSFGAPVILNSPLRPGSLRKEAEERGVPIVVYEAGEALRFDENSIRAGVKGVISVMRLLDMLPAGRTTRLASEAVISRQSVWVRAPETGILGTRHRLGARIRKGGILGTISDSLGEVTRDVLSPVSGILVGRNLLPLANEGDALFHIATFDALTSVVEELDTFREDLELDPLEDVVKA